MKGLLILSELERNVLQVSLDHMEEHLLELMSERTLHGPEWKERLNACRNLQKAIL